MHRKSINRFRTKIYSFSALNLYTSEIVFKLCSGFTQLVIDLSTCNVFHLACIRNILLLEYIHIVFVESKKND